MTVSMPEVSQEDMFIDQIWYSSGRVSFPLFDILSLAGITLRRSVSESEMGVDAQLLRRTTTLLLCPFEAIRTTFGSSVDAQLLRRTPFQNFPFPSRRSVGRPFESSFFLFRRTVGCTTNQLVTFFPIPEIPPPIPRIAYLPTQALFFGNLDLHHPSPIDPLIPCIKHTRVDKQRLPSKFQIPRIKLHRLSFPSVRPPVLHLHLLLLVAFLITIVLPLEPGSAPAFVNMPKDMQSWPCPSDRLHQVLAAHTRPLTLLPRAAVVVVGCCCCCCCDTPWWHLIQQPMRRAVRDHDIDGRKGWYGVLRRLARLPDEIA